jgi:hypothetical protein
MPQLRFFVNFNGLIALELTKHSTATVGDLQTEIEARLTQFGVLDVSQTYLLSVGSATPELNEPLSHISAGESTTVDLNPR